VLSLGVEYLEIGPRPIYLLENIFQTVYILIYKTEHSSCRPRGQFFFFKTSYMLSVARGTQKMGSKRPKALTFGS
jgi:hypothetical protein